MSSSLKSRSRSSRALTTPSLRAGLDVAHRAQPRLRAVRELEEHLLHRVDAPRPDPGDAARGVHGPRDQRGSRALGRLHLEPRRVGDRRIAVDNVGLRPAGVVAPRHDQPAGGPPEPQIDGGLVEDQAGDMHAPLISQPHVVRHAPGEPIPERDVVQRVLPGEIQQGDPGEDALEPSGEGHLAATDDEPRLPRVRRVRQVVEPLHGDGVAVGRNPRSRQEDVPVARVGGRLGDEHEAAADKGGGDAVLIGWIEKLGRLVGCRHQPVGRRVLEQGIAGPLRGRGAPAPLHRRPPERPVGDDREPGGQRDRRRQGEEMAARPAHGRLTVWWASWPGPWPGPWPEAPPRGPFPSSARRTPA